MFFQNSRSFLERINWYAFPEIYEKIIDKNTNLKKILIKKVSKTVFNSDIYCSYSCDTGHHSDGEHEEEEDLSSDEEDQVKS